MFNKIIKKSIVIAFSLIVLYGIGFAQQTYKNTILDTCLSRSNIISSGYDFDNSPIAHPNSLNNGQKRLNLCANNCLADFSAENTCCETERCDNFSQTTNISISLIQDCYPHNKALNTISYEDGSHIILGPKSIPKSLKAVPIYIMTQSFIC